MIHNHRFMVLWAGNGLSLIGTSGVRIAYPLLVLGVTRSPALAGWVTLALGVPGLIFQLPAGILADYVNRRAIMLVCQIIGLIATAAAALAVIGHTPHLTIVLATTAFIEGTAFVFFGLAEVAAIRDLVDDEQRPAAFSFYEAEQPVALLAGRALGASLLGVGRVLPFIANAISYAFCVGSLATMPNATFAPHDDTPADPAAELRKSFWPRIGEGLRWAWSIPFLRVSTLITALTNVLFQVIILLVIVVSTERSWPTWTVGIILAGAGVGGIGGSIVAAPLTRRYAAASLYAGCLWAWTVLLTLVAISADPWLLALAWGGIGAVGTVNSVALTMARVQAVPDTVLGRVIGAIAMVTDGAVPLGAVIGGYTLTAWSTRTTAWILSLTMVVLALIGGRFAAKVRARLRTEGDNTTRPDPAVGRTEAH
jgi:MFS family permease